MKWRKKQMCRLKHKRRWGRGPSEFVHQWKPQKQKQGKPEAWDAGTNCGLHAYYLELVSMDLEHLGPFWLPRPPLRDPPCSYQSCPFWSFALDLWYYGLVLFSVVAESNVYNKSSTLLSYMKKKKFKLKPTYQRSEMTNTGVWECKGILSLYLLL